MSTFFSCAASLTSHTQLETAASGPQLRHVTCSRVRACVWHDWYRYSDTESLLFECRLFSPKQQRSVANSALLTWHEAVKHVTGEQEVLQVAPPFGHVRETNSKNEMFNDKSIGRRKRGRLWSKKMPVDVNVCSYLKYARSSKQSWQEIAFQTFATLGNLKDICSWRLCSLEGSVHYIIKECSRAVCMETANYKSKQVTMVITNLLYVK